MPRETNLKGSDFPGAVPAFARDFNLAREADGRLVFHGMVEGAHVWVQPQGSTMTNFRNAAATGEAAGTINFGLQMGQIKSHQGALETNDAGFGQMFGATSRVPLPSGPPSSGKGDLLTPSLIVAVGLLAAGVLMRFRNPRA